jgi:acid phosphatase
MNKKLVCATPLVALLAFGLYACGGNGSTHADLSSVKNVVVIYAENRSFDNLYGNFPGANGMQNVTAQTAKQLDRDGSVLTALPAVWGGLTAKGVTPAITEAMTVNMPNAPFAIDDPAGYNTSLSVTTRDLYHRFYENQMQIDGGKNDKFAAWADSGGLVMGHYNTNPDKLPLYKIAQQFTLADNFFMSAFGGSFLNHQWLVCACTPVYPNADKSPAAASISVVNPRVAQARGQLARVGAHRHSEVRQLGQPHARFLRDQHDAAAVSAERQQAGRRRRSGVRRPVRRNDAAAADAAAYR